uniref:Uncharacterized protein n=1 Tax=Bactrocera dorsalis TaxID=27457 RepID=A0A034WQF2_BACDO
MPFFKPKDCEDTNKDLSEEFRHHVSERVKLYEASMKGSGSPAKISINKNNNIRHVVPVGVLIVFFTLYLTTTAIQFKYVNYANPEDEKNSDFSNTLKGQEMQAEKTTKRIKILEKLLEYKDLCTELEVFTKDLRWVNEIIEKENQLKEIDTECLPTTEESVLISLDVENGENHHQKETKHREIVDLQHTNTDKSKIAPQINNKNAKNINSTAINNNNKKDQSTAKKSNTAEPIIYMFALVFIYLLLKAASDINQHYKSQNKGDKRLRRCSLQSYAQTHKQDRRASKGTSYNKPSPSYLYSYLLKDPCTFLHAKCVQFIYGIVYCSHFNSTTFQL